MLSAWGERCTLALWSCYACIVETAGGKPDATMFYVIAERRMNGKLRKMYLRYASDTSAGGHIVSTMQPEQAYNSKKASNLLVSAVRLFPEWGLSLHPVNPGFLTLESAGRESDRDAGDFDNFYIPSRSPGRHWRVQLHKPQIGSPHIGAVEGIMQYGQFTYETSKVPRSATFYLVHNSNSIKATLNALLMFMVKECYITDYHAKAFIPQRYQA
jgi:hypothetical protein